MTTKAPQAPTTEPKVETTTAPPKKTSGTVESSGVRFWGLLLEVQKLIEDIEFSQNKGAGGSALKDAHKLKNQANKLLRERGIVYVMAATENVQLEVIGDTNIFVHGHYRHTWRLDGVVVHEDLHYGGFNTLISARTNAAYAVHGALTSATTDVLFDTLNAATLVSDDDFDSRNQDAYNRQPGGKAIPPINSSDDLGY